MLFLIGTSSASFAGVQSVPGKVTVTDLALAKSLPGFTNSTANVNGIHLHYVSGGSGFPIILLPGWPETWWAYHKVMPELSKTDRVISVDLRGMGASDKPADGYDKKTPGSTTVRIEGTGHFIAEEKPAALLEYCHNFFE